MPTEKDTPTEIIPVQPNTEEDVDDGIIEINMDDAKEPEEK